MVGAFIVKDWKDAPSPSTPIDALALEDMEKRLSGYTDFLESGLGDAAFKNVGAAGTADKILASDDERLPTAGEKEALAGSKGAPGKANKYLTQESLGETGEEGRPLRADDHVLFGAFGFEVIVHKYLDQKKVAEEKDVTAELAEADKVAKELNVPLRLPWYAIIVEGEIKRGNEANRKWRIKRSGPGSKIIDKNTKGPILSYVRTDEAQNGAVDWEFDYELACQKPESSCFRLEELRTSHSRININVQGNNTSKFYKCREVFRFVNMWEFSMAETSFSEIVGHTIWYDCPDLNGGNVDLSNVRQIFCTGGVVIKGNSTTNNVLFGNFKALNSNGGREYYEKRVASLPGIGAKEVQVTAGLAANYFPAGGTVLLYSAAGLDIMHLDSAAPYNAETGKLKFWDATTKDHAAAGADMRVIGATNWGVITDFYTPNMNFVGAHFERSPIFIKDGGATFDSGCIISTAHSSNKGEVHGVYLAGKNGHARFEKVHYAHPGGAEAAYAMLCPLTPAPTATSGTPTFYIDDIRTPPSGEAATMTNVLWKPFNSPDGIYSSKSELPVGCMVKTLVKGMERNTIPAESAYRSSRVVEATATIADNDDIVIAKKGNITLSLPSLRNKVVTIIKADASETSPVIIKASTAGTKIEGQEEIKLVMPNSSVTIAYEKESNEFRIVVPPAVGTKREMEGTAEIAEGSTSKEVEHKLNLPEGADLTKLRIFYSYEGAEITPALATREKTLTKFTVVRTVGTKVGKIHWRAVFVP